MGRNRENQGVAIKRFDGRSCHNMAYRNDTDIDRGVKIAIIRPIGKVGKVGRTG
jgi:hypothetical protein